MKECSIKNEKDTIYLSIVIPVYRVEQYIEKCVKSVVDQITSEVEVIIVDDCSPDESIQKCEKYVNEKNNISIVKRKENGGLSAARNTGIRNATGKFCWFVDSDDFISLGAIKRILGYIKADANTELIMFDHDRINEKGDILFESNLTNELIEINSVKNKINIINKYLRNDFGFEVWRKIFSLDIIKKNNIKFEPNKEIFAEDICFFLYYINYCKNIMIKNDSNYMYLVRENSIMGQKKTAKINEIINLSSKVFNYTGASDIKKINSIILFRLIQIEIGEADLFKLKNITIDPENKKLLLKHSMKKFNNIFFRIKYYGKKSTITQVAEMGYIESSIKYNPLRKKWYYRILKRIGEKNEKSTTKD